MPELAQELDIEVVGELEKEIYMKAFNNTTAKRLLAIPGLFVALVGLTSFNPFTEASHLVALQKEESTTLTSTAPSARKGERLEVAPSESVTARLEALRAGKTRPATVPPLKQEEPKTEEDKKESADLDAKSKTSGGVCVDCDKPEQLIDISKLSTSELQIYLDEKRAQETADGIADICSEGTVSKRVKCFEDAKKGLRRNSEEYGLVLEQIEDFVEEITLDEESKVTELRKLLKLVRGDRELSEAVRAAISYKEIQKRNDSFARHLENSADQIANLDSQIAQMSMYEQSGNAQAIYQLNMMKIQRTQMVNNLEREISGFQNYYKSALPRPRANGDEHEIIATLRDNMSADYEAVISPIAGIISNQALISLDAQSYASLGTTGVTGGPNSSIFNPGNNAGALPNTAYQTRPLYSSQDPYMTGNSRINMNPIQQIQTFGPGQNGMVSNNFGPNTMPIQGQVIPGQSRF